MLEKLKSGLSPYEEVLFQLKPNTKRYFLSSVWIILPCFFFSGFLAPIITFLTVDMSGMYELGMIELTFQRVFARLFYYWPVAFLALILIGAILRIIDYKNTFYVITSQRIMKSSGVFTDKIVNHDYSFILSMQLHIGLFDKLCNTGSILYKIKDGKIYGVTMATVFLRENPVNFEQLIGIENAEAVYKRLKEIALDIKADILYPNDYREVSQERQNHV